MTSPPSPPTPADTLRRMIAHEMDEARELSEMTQGYLDGLSDTRPDFPELTNRSEAYRHGWLNGRDDRIGEPRACAETLRSEAALLDANP